MSLQQSPCMLRGLEEFDCCACLSRSFSYCLAWGGGLILSLKHCVVTCISNMGLWTNSRLLCIPVEPTDILVKRDFYNINYVWLYVTFIHFNNQTVGRCRELVALGSFASCYLHCFVLSYHETLLFNEVPGMLCVTLEYRNFVSERTCIMSLTAFWGVTPCSLVDKYQHFKGTCYLNI
jgi:hypothetical protein